jgi:hypothetical protein
MFVMLEQCKTSPNWKNQTDECRHARSNQNARQQNFATIETGQAPNLSLNDCHAEKILAATIFVRTRLTYLKNSKNLEQDSLLNFKNDRDLPIILVLFLVVRTDGVTADN